MEKLIPFINEVHVSTIKLLQLFKDILHKANLNNQLQLPQIVVIGSQSVGKSSLVESIVGKEFLPRGKGIVTRRPIEIQLIQKLDEDDEWFELFDRKGDKFREPDEIRKAIEAETEKICGKNKSVSNIPIKLKYFSRNIVDLMLLDLPGLTKNPVGDQPADIEQKIVDLIMPFISNPSSLILAVTKASDDLAISDGLKLARQVDRDGLRTIGVINIFKYYIQVITQLDLVDEGVDNLNDLLNKTYPLQLGYVGVIMRGAKDTQKNKTISDQILDEKLYFENHKQYKKYADKMGIPYLVKTLNMFFIQHIKKSLPLIRESIINFIQLKEYDLKQYGDFESLDSKEAKSYLILNLISKFSYAYKDMLDGKYLNSSEELIGGSRIIFVFNEIFRKTVQKMNPFDILTDDVCYCYIIFFKDIRTAIKNANGIRPSLFVPEGAFELLVRQQISRLELPSLECSHLVYEELRRVLNQISIPEVDRFDVLSNRIFEVIEQLLHRCLSQTDQLIKNLVEIELGYINTSHPDFVSGVDLIQKEDHNVQSDDQLQPSSIIQQMKQKKRKNEEPQAQNFFGFWPFQKNNKQTELYDSKLDMMNKKRKKQPQIVSESEMSMQEKQISTYQNVIFNPEQNKRSLPQVSNKYILFFIKVPNIIKIMEKPSRREQTEMDMIKDLIVSYFNVVKKNINDNVPKTIITFLVNQSRNCCEREMIGQLYKSESLDELLTENQFISKSRADTKKTLSLLRQCLNMLNDLDAKF